MQVINHLAALGAAVKREAIAPFREPLGFSDPLGGQHHAPDKGDVCVLERHHRLDVAPGDEEEVDRGLGIEIPEDHDLVVFVLDLCQALFGHNLTEETLHRDLPQRDRRANWAMGYPALMRAPSKVTAMASFPLLLGWNPSPRKNVSSGRAAKTSARVTFSWAAT